jgi:hypothetical protein
MNWIWKRVTVLFGHEHDLPLYGKIALPLVLVGVTLMAPSWRDAALAVKNCVILANSERLRRQHAFLPGFLHRQDPG